MLVTLLTVKELSQFLKVKEKTLYQWAELSQIPYFKLNGTLRFDLDDIRKWIAACKKDPSSGYNPLTKLEARKGGRN
jgi:excisionase family DNA binding protein